MTKNLNDLPPVCYFPDMYLLGYYVLKTAQMSHKTKNCLTSPIVDMMANMNENHLVRTYRPHRGRSGA